MKLTGTRTFLEIRVGPVHSVEVVLHVRRRDLPWFETIANDPDGTASAVTTAAFLMDVLEQQILPRHFTESMVRDMSKHLQKKVPPTMLGPGGRPVLPLETTATVLAAGGPPKKKGKRRGRGGGKQAVAAAAAAVIAAELAAAADKKKNVYYAVSEKLEVTYRLQEISVKSQHQTLVFASSSEDKGASLDIDKSSSSNLKALIKLPQRILLWCSLPNSEPESSGGGFSRPEMIPMAGIFREPRDEELEVRSKKAKVIVLDD